MQLDLFAEHASCSGKTSLAHFPQTAEETLLPWLEQWLDASYLYHPQDGGIPALLLDETDSSSGACLTLNMSEFNHIPEQSRSAVDACSLSSILETGEIDRRYFLSQKACAGILRRAEKRGRVLPLHLRRALEEVAGLEWISTAMEG